MLLAQFPTPAIATRIGFVALIGVVGAGRAFHWALGPFISIMLRTPFITTVLLQS
jgi:hypothetical protein